MHSGRLWQKFWRKVQPPSLGMKSGQTKPHEITSTWLHSSTSGS
jgi:hypothetical protein